MILKAFSIRDLKAQQFNTPFFKAHSGEALRDFRSAVNDSKTTLNQYPEDFALWQIGQYDSDTGTLVPAEPTHISDAVGLKNQ